MLFLMLATCASSCPRIRRNKNLRLKYRSNKRIVYFACRSGFEIIGATSAICNENTWSTDFPICVAPGCRFLEYDDNVLDVTYTYRGSLATFQCKANYVMEDEDNRVYCNKREWNKPPPVCKKHSVKTSCNYEDGICGWTQDNGDDFDWEIHSEETPTRSTGPFNDHTYGNASEGHYIYIEASAPRRPGDQARLISPLYNFKMQAVCFEFWFHMWCPSLTKETGSLQIYAISKKQLLSNLAPLMTLTGNYGNSWKRKRIQLEPMQDTFQIILHATRGQNHQNDIAVDDIQLWAGLCDDAPNTTHPLLLFTKILTKATTPSSFLENKTVAAKGKETILTTLSIQPTFITSTINYELKADKKMEPITTQATSTKILITRTSSSTEMKFIERVSNTNATTSATTDFISQKLMESSSITSITRAEALDQDNVSKKFTFEPSSVVNIEGKGSREDIENYTPLAIGITVALLFGIGVIFFIVWIWARSQDRKRAMAEEEEETQPITNTGSNCSLQNGF